MSEHNFTLADLNGLGLEDFDPAEYITSDEAAAVYINEALLTNDAALLASAIGDVARARGMTEIAKKAGIAREALYKALRENSQPRMETIARVLGAMKLQLMVVPIGAEGSVENGARSGTVRVAKIASKPAPNKTAPEQASAKKPAVRAAKPATKKAAA